MPSKHVVRNFTEENVYHIYNKGLEDKIIFQDPQEYEIFLYYIYIYTKPLERVLEKYPNLPFRLRYNNIAQEVDIIAYSLLPTHFHLLVRQHTRDGIPRLLKQLTNAYTYYYNRKNKRSGPLMQGRYKAAGVDIDKQLKYLIRHLDREPEQGGLTPDFSTYPYSSCHEYLEENDNQITKQRLIRSFLSNSTNYSSFMDDEEDYQKTYPTIKDILIEKHS